MVKKTMEENNKALENIQRMEKLVRGVEKIKEEQEQAMIDDFEKWLSESMDKRKDDVAFIATAEEWSQEKESKRKLRILKEMEDHIEDHFENRAEKH